MRVRLLDEAEQDLRDGIRYYESQQEGIGDYFADSLLSDAESLRLYAGIHPRQYGYYKLLSKRFPYAIYYRIEGGVAFVHAILDCRRDPSRIRGRLKG